MTSALHIQLELAEMVDRNGLAQGELFPSGELHPPLDIHLDSTGERLHWSEPGSLEKDDEMVRYATQRRSVDPTGALDRFLRIRGANDVLRFAQRYGPLRLCEDGLPSAHKVSQLWDEPWPPGPVRLPYGFPDDCSEPTARWYDYVSQAKGLVEIGAAIWRGRPGSRAAWDAVLSNSRPEGVDQESIGSIGKTKERDRAALSCAIDHWIEIANVRFYWAWHPHHREPEFWLHAGTFGTLVLQLVAVLTRAYGVAICDGCSIPYLRLARKPQAGRRNFCPTCGEKMASRLRQRDLRARRKGES